MHTIGRCTDLIRGGRFRSHTVAAQIRHKALCLGDLHRQLLGDVRCTGLCPHDGVVADGSVPIECIHFKRIPVDSIVVLSAIHYHALIPVDGITVLRRRQRHGGNDLAITQELFQRILRAGRADGQQPVDLLHLPLVVAVDSSTDMARSDRLRCRVVELVAELLLKFHPDAQEVASQHLIARVEPRHRRVLALVGGGGDGQHVAVPVHSRHGSGVTGVFFVILELPCRFKLLCFTSSEILRPKAFRAVAGIAGHLYRTCRCVELQIEIHIARQGLFGLLGGGQPVLSYTGLHRHRQTAIFHLVGVIYAFRKSGELDGEVAVPVALLHQGEAGFPTILLGREHIVLIVRAVLCLLLSPVKVVHQAPEPHGHIVPVQLQVVQRANSSPVLFLFRLLVQRIPCTDHLLCGLHRCRSQILPIFGKPYTFDRDSLIFRIIRDAIARQERLCRLIQLGTAAGRGLLCIILPPAHPLGKRAIIAAVPHNKRFQLHPGTQRQRAVGIVSRHHQRAGVVVHRVAEVIVLHAQHGHVALVDRGRIPHVPVHERFCILIFQLTHTADSGAGRGVLHIDAAPERHDLTDSGLLVIITQRHAVQLRLGGGGQRLIGVDSVCKRVNITA